MGSESLPKEPTTVFYVYAGEELALSGRLRVQHYRPATVEDITDEMVYLALAARGRAHSLDPIERMRAALEAVFRGD